MKVTVIQSTNIQRVPLECWVLVLGTVRNPILPALRLLQEWQRKRVKWTRKAQ